MILLLIGAILVIVLVGIVVIIIAAILMLIGHIGLIILNFKLNEFEKNTLYLVAGIMFIIGIFIGVTDIIGWILMYVALGDSINKRSTAVLTPRAPV